MFRNLFSMLGRLGVLAITALVLIAPAPACAATNQIALVIPDTLSPTDPRVTSWQDAALEEGLQITLVTDTQVLAGITPAQFSGMILPDTLHTNAADTLVTAVTNYANQGGKVMLVYDFGALTSTGFYSAGQSRFSTLAGVSYVLYDTLGANMIGLGPVTGLSSTLRTIQVPPGKSMAWTTTASTDPVEGISGYVYGFLNYPSYVTKGTYDGTVMMTSPTFGFVAGVRNVGSGQVLFINLPLTYLKGQTDGMLMHGFLRYFGSNLLQMPRLSAQPKGRGGLVLNVHFCAEDQFVAAQQLQTTGFFNNGPFSIIITAGPDKVAFGDGLGINLSQNTAAQQMVQYLLSKGHNIGNHGGWIHDYWGANASETNAATFTQYLVMNKQSVEAATGKPTVEYGAPEGNTPQWSLDWLESMGNTGYYFVGHTGMAPTRSYRNGALLNKTIRAFPVMPFGKYATFEEFEEFGVPSASITTWYNQLMDFVMQNRTSRLIYMHPLGAIDYPTVLNALFARASWYHLNGQFNWYTIDTLAKFAQQRQQTSWTATDAGVAWLFQANNSGGLTDQTWVLPMSAYNQPVVTLGNATVTWDSTNWLVTAGAGTSLTFTSGKH